MSPSTKRTNTGIAFGVALLCLQAQFISTNPGVQAFSTTPLCARPAHPFNTMVQSAGRWPAVLQSTTSSTESMENDVKDTSNIEETDSSKSWKDDGFVFGLDGSGLDRPKGRTSQVVVEGDSLETTPAQQAIVSLTFAGHFWFLSQAFGSMLTMANGNVALAVAQSAFLTVTSWVLADLGSGILHWSVDNYGNGQTPVMGSIIAAFQGHHSAPWTITERGFCNNVYKLCTPFGLPTMAVIQFLAGGAGPVSWFFTTFCMFEILSQEFHKWSHQLPSETPGWVNWLQKVGLTVPRKPHALHHIAPYEGNYCIISGICNEALDQSGFFRRLERFVYSRNGVEPNAWKLDADLRQRTMSGDYGLPTMD